MRELLTYLREKAEGSGDTKAGSGRVDPLQEQGNNENGGPGLSTDSRPIEPKGGVRKPGLLSWVLFLLLLSYIIVSLFHEPLFTRLGSYLVVEHPLRKADAVICLSGGVVERGLATASIYNKGLAPEVIITREAWPDGFEELKRRGVDYPENRGLLLKVLKGLGVPGSACVTEERFVKSTYDEAVVVKEIAGENGYESIIIVTSPTHTRRAWLTFRHVLDPLDMEIIMRPSAYSDFKADAWWKDRNGIEDVVIEYQKLIFYWLKYFL